MRHMENGRFLAFLVVGCGVLAGCRHESDGDAGDVSVLAPAPGPAPVHLPPEEYRYEHSGVPFASCVRADHLLAAKRLENRWPLEAYRSRAEARRRGEPWSEDLLFFLGTGSVSNGPSRVVRWRGELDLVFLFGGGRIQYELHYVGGGGRPALVLDTMDPMSEAVGVSCRALDVAVSGDLLLVVYATPSDAYGSPSSLRQIEGVLRDGEVELGPPETVFEGRRRVFDVELVVAGDRVHLLWQMGPRLAHSSRPVEGGAWSPPTVLSESCNPYGASLAADGDRVYVAWSDDRFQRMEGFGPVNGRKLLVTHSSDGGRSFGEPVLIGSRTDKADSTAQTYLAFAGDRPVLVRRAEGDELWKRVILDEDLGGYWPLESVSGEELERAYETWARPRLAGEK